MRRSSARWGTRERRAARAEREAIARLVATLTPRDRDALALVVAGRPNKLVADRLGASGRTVKDQATSRLTLPTCHGWSRVTTTLTHDRNVRSAKARLSELLQRAAAGEEIVIAAAGRPKARKEATRGAILQHLLPAPQALPAHRAPGVAVITDGKRSDIRVVRTLRLEPGTIVVHVVIPVFPTNDVGLGPRRGQGGLGAHSSPVHTVE